ncbi:solute carrier family 49 member A3-like [Diadema antillarum]|uniref:solute carrier family 49 member A3-like n=1 Tax=Diadema antillarum TaxID=105358 RepID=UPI003A898799
MPHYRQIYNQSSDDEYRHASLPGARSHTPPALSRDGTTGERTVYKRRWLVIAVLALVNISSALAWISFAPIANYAATYMNTTDANINWLSTVYMVTTIPFGFVAVGILDTWGLAPVIILGACCNMLGLVIRYLAVFKFCQDYRYVVVLVGQGVASLAQPCFLFTPTKVAATWFPESQRATANTLGSTSNPLGILLGMLLSSMLVTDADGVEFLLLLYMIPGVVSGVLAVAVMCYCKNAPPRPPSASAASHHESFIAGLKKLITIRAFWVLCLVFGAGLAVFNAITSIMEEVLCPQGYSDNFSGICGAVMIGSGIVGAFLSGLYVDRTKKFGLVAKVAFALSAVCAVALSILSRYPHMPAAIVGTCAAVGFFGFAQFPVSLELGVEATYPVSEGTSAGFLIMSGQIQGILLMLAAQWLANPLSPTQQASSTCQVTSATIPGNASSHLFWWGDEHEEIGFNSSSGISNDMSCFAPLTVTMLFYGGYAAVAAIIYILGFHTKYKRIRAEHCNAADHILNFSRRSVGEGGNVIY